MSNLQDMTLIELRNLARENNIKNISKLKKEDLITVLSQVIGEIKSTENTNKKTHLTNHNETEEVKNPTQYDANGQPIVDYKLTNEGDEIVEGILDILPDGYGFLRGENFLSTPKDVYISMVRHRRYD